MIGDLLKFIQDVGIPIASALACGAFLFIILKFLLGQISDSVSSFGGKALKLENKLDVMNNEIVKIDTLISCAFKTEPNLNRIAASEGKEDARDD
ncbi:MAG: hypothetical protein ACO3HJ_06560 [Methylophilaceae bacterium]